MHNYLMITLKIIKVISFVMAKTQTELFICKWQIQNFGALFCWSKHKKKKKSKNLIVCFLMRKYSKAFKNCQVIWPKSPPLRRQGWFSSHKQLHEWFSKYNSSIVVINVNSSDSTNIFYYSYSLILKIDIRWSRVCPSFLSLAIQTLLF